MKTIIIVHCPILNRYFFFDSQKEAKSAAAWLDKNYYTEFSYNCKVEIFSEENTFAEFRDQAKQAELAKLAAEQKKVLDKFDMEVWTQSYKDKSCA